MAAPVLRAGHRRNEFIGWVEDAKQDGPENVLPAGPRRNWKKARGSRAAGRVQAPQADRHMTKGGQVLEHTQELRPASLVGGGRLVLTRAVAYEPAGRLSWFGKLKVKPR